MKKITFTLIGDLALVACENGDNQSAQVTLSNNIDSVSYAIGTSQAKGLMVQVPELNVDALLIGYQDVVDSTDLRFIDDEDKVIL